MCVKIVVCVIKRQVSLSRWHEGKDRVYITYLTPASVCRIRAAVGAGRTAFRESWRAVDSLLRVRRLETLSALQPLAEIQVHMRVSFLRPNGLPLAAGRRSTADCMLHPRTASSVVLRTAIDCEPPFGLTGSCNAVIKAAIQCRLLNTQEVLDLWPNAGTVRVADVAALADRWQRRWPSARHASPAAALTVANMRHLLLDALWKKLPSGSDAEQLDRAVR